MLNIRRAPATDSELARKINHIYKNKITHLRGVNPRFSNCSIPIEIIIDHSKGELYLNMLLEDLNSPAALADNDYVYSSVEDTVYDIPQYEPAINIIEDYLDRNYSFENVDGEQISFKDYFIKNNIALFYSCGCIIDDMLYAEDLKKEIQNQETEKKIKEVKLDGEPTSNESIKDAVNKNLQEIFSQDNNSSFFQDQKEKKEEKEPLYDIEKLLDLLEESLKESEEEEKETQEEKERREMEEDTQKLRYALQVLNFSNLNINKIINNYNYNDFITGQIPCPYNPATNMNDNFYCSCDHYSAKPHNCIKYCPGFFNPNPFSGLWI